MKRKRFVNKTIKLKQGGLISLLRDINNSKILTILEYDECDKETLYLIGIKRKFSWWDKFMSRNWAFLLVIDGETQKASISDMSFLNNLYKDDEIMEVLKLIKKHGDEDEN